MRKLRRFVAIVATMAVCLTSVSAGVFAGTDVTVKRIYGQTRYATSQKVADELLKVKGVDKFDNIVVAYGGSSSDALSGSYLARVTNAPLLTVNTTAQSESDVLKYVKSKMKKSGTVYLLGGTARITKRFETNIKKQGFAVKRLAGNTKYDTNIQVIKQIGNITGRLGYFYVCNGNGYADSLTCSGLDAPILLVDKKLTANQKEFLYDVNITNEFGTSFTIAGGTGSVSSTVENELKSYTKGDESRVKRVAGKTRYESNRLMVQRSYDVINGGVIVYGENYPDGISAGVLAGELRVPIILASNKNTKEAAEIVNGRTVSQLYVIGGPALISDSAVAKIKSSAQSEDTVIVNEGKELKVRKGQTVEITLPDGTEKSIYIENIRIASKERYTLEGTCDGLSARYEHDGNNCIWWNCKDSTLSDELDNPYFDINHTGGPSEVTVKKAGVKFCWAIDGTEPQYNQSAKRVAIDSNKWITSKDYFISEEDIANGHPNTIAAAGTIEYNSSNNGNILFDCKVSGNGPTFWYKVYDGNKLVYETMQFVL